MGAIRSTSKPGKVAMWLVVIAGAALFAVAYLAGKGSTDGQEALVLPFVVFWTVCALVVVWLADFSVRAVWEWVRPSR